MTTLAQLEDECRKCRACPLCQSRMQVVAGQGRVTAPLVVIGEAPGSEEDQQGCPFVGPAGQLLDQILQAAQIRREEVYLTNVVKCRPPHNRDPHSSETALCAGLWLRPQLQLLRPRVVVTLGNIATQHLLQTRQRISQLRGKWFQYQYSGEQGSERQTLLMPMLHPAYLLRRDSRQVGDPKRLTWQDIQEVASVLRGETNPSGTADLDDQPGLL